MEENENLIKASPAKRFFVEMFTRDIELQDSILDLLDNCVDGVVRTLETIVENPPEDHHLPSDTPYEGYFAKISFSQERFTIVDNCGGIPIPIAKNQAFRMGRPDSAKEEHLSTVGMYGIGMKRSIFKMGKSCVIKSYTKEGAYQVRITPEWMASDELWDLEMELIDGTGADYGTHIEITQLNPNISTLFGDDGAIHTDLPKIISQHFGYIIQKGFIVTINNEDVKPQILGLLVSGDERLEPNGLSPYIYQGVFDDVEVSLVIGFYRPMADPDEVEEETLTRRSTQYAGWSVVCNDRVVLHNDKSRMTGWAEGNVPAYHTQFIGIMGVVFFTSTNPKKLPLTTTKRGVDGSSQLYLYIKGFMRNGLKKFTDYTYQWKKNPEEEKIQSSKAKMMSIESVFQMANERAETWRNVRNNPNEKYIDLPLAKVEEGDPLKQIKFHKRLSEINKVSALLYGEEVVIKPADVGEKCFDLISKGGAR